MRYAILFSVLLAASASLGLAQSDTLKKPQLGIVEKLKLVGENAMGILMMDHQLGSRTAAG